VQSLTLDVIKGGSVSNLMGVINGSLLKRCIIYTSLLRGMVLSA